MSDFDSRTEEKRKTGLVSLSDGNIRLRAPEPDDLDALYSIENDTALWVVSGNAIPFSRYQLNKYIMESAHDFYTDRQIRFMIVSESDEKVLGCIDLTDIDPYNGRAEVGVALLPAFRGQGIASAALKIISKYSCFVLRLHQLFCQVPADNVDCFNLFENNGFSESGRLRDWLVNNNSYSEVILMQKFF
ncbi:MAG: GNAT family N-acetyltransferase [Bacteroidaceae bacterium]|nr:GNAT family N-acetyltransferase [Bacteroidaceae bacterium]